ncbi:MAG: tRNA uridine-5-carboxymethylaminomethyl(34) synthesis GTPase MnmE [Bacteroidota bacterium]|nr:tRNA uridine-5-carboxymethylaminomethyl(34) synthesis GTPase MnmE [Bacteroidota bacterium]
MLINQQDTIIAPATNSTIASALGIVRLSGEKAIEIVAKVFLPKSQKVSSLLEAKANHTYFGQIFDNQHLIDEVVVCVYKAPHSFTGENLVEITHHGSPFISKTIINLLLKNGARLSERGEFSQRAFLNGKINLSQAEAIADIIASKNKASLDLALNQLRGGYNDMLHSLREKFLHIASLLELEIDFSEEHEIFVDREQLLKELDTAKHTLQTLLNSFEQGNAFKNGIPIAIVGKPNSGKSTLLNAILNEERAIVSDIEGTTRDTIEERLMINDLEYRFIDTAGIRESENTIERKGIERSFLAIDKAMIVILLLDLNDKKNLWQEQEKELLKGINIENKAILRVLNKIDTSKITEQEIVKLKQEEYIIISAKENLGIDILLKKIEEITPQQDFTKSLFLTNARHYSVMQRALEEINLSQEGVNNMLSSDLVAENIRMAINYLGQITGEVCNEDILQNIFSNFCIGK